LLPRVVPSSGVAATTRCEGLPDGIAIAGIAGDQQAALFGQACHQPGMAKNTYGTGCFLLMNTGAAPAASKNRLLATVAWQRGGKATYALEGSVFIAGAAIQWLRDGLGMIERAADMDALAASVPDAGGVFFVPALSGLGAPYWDPHARGAIVGITRGTTRAHLARATLEAIAFQSAELIEAMSADSGIGLTQLRVDGGATASNLLMQIQADLLGVAVVRPKVTETTALGAAYLAGLAVGFWKDEGEIAAMWSRDRVFEPTLSRDAARARLAEWKRAVERSRGWAQD
jgi:glycerol kinase